MSVFKNLAFWTDAEMLECVTRTPEAPDVVTFSFQSPSGALFNHDPGQFVTLELPVPGGRSTGPIRYRPRRRDRRR